MSVDDIFHLGGDLPIKRLGFGAMRLPTAGWHGPPRDPEMGRAVLRRAIELGVNHIDTADFYHSGDRKVRANVLIREALHPYPKGLVIATKVGPNFSEKGPSPAKPSELRGHVERNLEMLKVDRLDLVYLRIGAMTVPHDESLGDRFEALARLREEGLIRHLGLSNVDTKHLTEAKAIAPVSAIQNNFNIATRSKEDSKLLFTCEKEKIAFVPFFPIGAGHTDLTNTKRKKVAIRHEATIHQVALAWLLSLSKVALAIPGTGSLDHLEENAKAADLTLTEKDLGDLS